MAEHASSTEVKDRAMTRLITNTQLRQSKNFEFNTGQALVSDNITIFHVHLSKYLENPRAL